MSGSRVVDNPICTTKATGNWSVVLTALCMVPVLSLHIISFFFLYLLDSKSTGNDAPCHNAAITTG